MKKQERAALKTKTTKELVTMREELAAELLKAKMEKFAGKLANTSLVKTLSDDMARVKTALRVLELAEQNQPVEPLKTSKKVVKKTKKA